jgi:hypothetical protein
MELRQGMGKPKRSLSGDALHFSWTMNMGAEGVDSDPMNPFARGLNRLLTDGQPLKKISLSFLNLPNSDADPAALRWLGVFVCSAADRLIFFPGYADVPGALIGFRDRSMMYNASEPTDHLSLERDRDSWHATTPNSRHHFGGPKPLDLGDGCILWFGMSFPNRDVMREAKTVTKIVADVPSSDARRRADVFKAARESIAFPIVSLNTEHVYDPQPGFYHLSVIVGPPGFAVYKGAEHGFPRGSPFLLDPLPDDLQVPISSYKLDMSPTCGLQITLMKLPGRISSNIALTSPAREQTAG